MACAAHLPRIGMDQITFEVDFPHADSTWPHTERVALETELRPWIESW